MFLEIHPSILSWTSDDPNSWWRGIFRQAGGRTILLLCAQESYLPFNISFATSPIQACENIPDVLLVETNPVSSLTMPGVTNQIKPLKRRIYCAHYWRLRYPGIVFDVGARDT